jgi:hypothetical protein
MSSKHFLFISIIASLIGFTFKDGFARAYPVGPDQPYLSIGDVPWESLTAGDSVLIHYRDAAYHEKWVICRAGTENAPIVVKGIPNEEGKLPVIDGRDATTRSNLNFWNEQRGVIKIGGANNPSDTLPQYIVIENLDIKSGRPPYSFTGRSGSTDYVDNCAAVYIEKGEHLIIRDCILHDCGNGLFCGNLTTDLVVENNYIYDNGIEGSIYEHNNYTEAYGILFQFNHFGALRAGCNGNNLKDRSAGCIIRYNWIENGNRQLDLVESDAETWYSDSMYRKTFVYGNILVEGEGEGNSQIIHYGGDGGDESKYRKGSLYLYNNTIVSTRSGNTTLVRLSSDGESCDAQNNIIYTTASGGHLAMLDDAGTISLRSNWLKTGWAKNHSAGSGTINDFGNAEGEEPGFIDLSTQNFSLADGSPCINSGTSLPSEVLPDHLPVMQYIRHCMAEPRPSDATLDIGAYEHPTAQGVAESSLPDDFRCICCPNPFNAGVTISYDLAQPTRVAVTIFDILGNKVRELTAEPKPAGHHSISWDSRNYHGEPVSTGLYFCRLETEAFTKVIKLFLVK